MKKRFKIIKNLFILLLLICFGIFIINKLINIKKYEQKVNNDMNMLYNMDKNELIELTIQTKNKKIIYKTKNTNEILKVIKCIKESKLFMPNHEVYNRDMEMKIITSYRDYNFEIGILLRNEFIKIGKIVTSNKKAIYYGIIMNKDYYHYENMSEDFYRWLVEKNIIE